MASKRVLIIAYQFPPMGGAGVQRTAKFVKYLPKYGYEPMVFTVDAPKGLNDDTLLEDIKNAKIIRSKSRDLSNWIKPFNILGKLITRKLMLPDGEWLWYRRNRRAVLKAVETFKPDVLYTTSYPYSDHLLGLHIKQHFPKLPWVVDFRDEWTKNPYILDMNHSKLRMNIEKKMEDQVINGCDYFITNSPFMLDNFKGDYDLDNRSTFLPNGFDQPDFEGLNINPEPNKKLTITYSGSMYGRRKPDPFLIALNQAINENRIDENDIAVQFVGNFSKQNIEKINTMLEASSIVKFHPYMPHKKSIEFLMNSDVLLLIVGKGTGDKNFYTGKIFEYINTGKTILGLVPEDGAAAMVINETHTGYTIDSTKIDEISDCLGKIYADWKNNQLKISPNHKAIQQYARANQARQLSEILNETIDIVSN